MILAVLSAAAASALSARVIDFARNGGKPGANEPTATAVENTALMNTLLSKLGEGGELVVGNETFVMMGGVIAEGLVHATIRIQGTLKFSNDIKAWPTGGKSGKSPITVCWSPL